jgi:hypothetical protein
VQEPGQGGAIFDALHPIMALSALLPAWTQQIGTNLPLGDGVEIAQKSADEIADLELTRP